MSAAARTCLITGGSRGIGAACAHLAAQQGWHVLITYSQNQAAALQVVADVAAQGGTAHALACDVGQSADIDRLFEQVDALQRQGWPALQGLVNNAGIVDQAARVEQMDAARINRMFAVNVTGSMLCAAKAVPRMSQCHGHGGGAIVNVSSVAARIGSPAQYVDYAASKAAIDTFTLGLSKEVAAEGIRVNAVRPGIIDTEIHASGGQPDRVRHIAPQLPMGRAGTAEEVARSIVWLLSHEASYITGAVLDVAGGR
jgi:NAD(P)-dependent dehydrogenase (short-subunit alcohol dehydrogenase family)